MHDSESMSLPVQEVKYNSGVRSEKYICWTRKQMRYMLGDHGYSYVVGNSPPNKPGQFPKRVHDRGASCPAPPANCSQVTALYNPQDNPNTISGSLVLVSAFLRLPVASNLEHADFSGGG